MIAVLLLGLFGCDADCEDLDRMNGTYAVWHQVGNSPMEGTASPLTLSEGFPTEELFVNGWTRWKLTYQSASNGVAVAMTDVLEPSDTPGEEPVFSAVEMVGTMNMDGENCNVVDVAIEDDYPASRTDGDGATLSQDTHTFKYTARLVFYGDQLSGTFTYTGAFSGTAPDGTSASGEITGATGAIIATRQTDADFDTGFVADPL